MTVTRIVRVRVHAFPIPPPSLLSMVQAVGRARRDGNNSTALLLTMKSYCDKLKCRRKVLFKDFDDQVDKIKYVMWEHSMCHHAWHSLHGHLETTYWLHLICSVESLALVVHLTSWTGRFYPLEHSNCTDCICWSIWTKQGCIIQLILYSIYIMVLHELHTARLF